MNKITQIDTKALIKLLKKLLASHKSTQTGPKTFIFGLKNSQKSIQIGHVSYNEVWTKHNTQPQYFDTLMT